ncbi:MAG: hybrid sensor histidine kinase/response regulator [Candidatus Zhuqueibacterota bacterium]
MKHEQNEKVRIFVIDDDPVMRLSCLKILEKEGFAVETFEDGILGLERIQVQKPDLLVVDLKMPKIGGLEVIARVHSMDPNICIVVITGYATIGTAVEAMKTGAYDFLPKPFTPDELRLIVNRGIERSQLAERSRQLKKEKENLERRFITFVSHQLQSPLVAVQQYLDVLLHLPDTPNKATLQREWIERSTVRVQELLCMIRDWLTISKIESGQFVACLSAVSIPPLIDEILLTYNEQARAANITLLSQLDQHLPAVNAQTECLKMLFSNLIVNAIKYGRRDGSVRIYGECNGNEITICVEDNGIGISEDQLPLIFEEFYRVKDENTKNIPGTGLGLPICKKIAKELAGSIDVKSKKGVGTIFIVKLPAQVL